MIRSLWLILIAAWGTAHAADVRVVPITILDKQQDGPLYPRSLRMPFITLPDAAVAADINDRLFIGQLNGLAPAKPTDTLDSINLRLDGLAEQDFELVRLDRRILSLRFDAEGCGAYCESYSVAYSFDLKTGRKLNHTDLFTPSGMHMVAEKMRREKQRLYRNQIAALQKSFKAEQRKSTPNPDELADLQERLELNRECAERIHEQSDDRAAFHYTWSFLPQHASLHAGRCSNHASRALDDVGDIELPLRYATLRPYMTAYGKSILLDEGTADIHNIYGQVLRGNLGKQPVVMLLERHEDNSISGTYFYSKYRKAIDLHGRVNGKRIELDERDPEGKIIARMQLRMDGNRLHGTWQQHDLLPVDLHAP